MKQLLELISVKKKAKQIKFPSSPDSYREGQGVCKTGIRAYKQKSNNSKLRTKENRPMIFLPAAGWGD